MIDKVWWATVSFILGTFVMAFVTWDWPTDKQIGMTWEEIREGKRICEENLPRNKSCKVLIMLVEEN